MPPLQRQLPLFVGLVATPFGVLLRIEAPMAPAADVAANALLAAMSVSAVVFGSIAWRMSIRAVPNGLVIPSAWTPFGIPRRRILHPDYAVIGPLSAPLSRIRRYDYAVIDFWSVSGGRCRKQARLMVDALRGPSSDAPRPLGTLTPWVSEATTWLEQHGVEVFVAANG